MGSFNNHPMEANGKAWRINRTISIGNLLHIIMLIAAMLTLYFGLKGSQDLTLQRVTAIEGRMSSMENRQDQMQELQRQMDEHLSEMKGKLDATIQVNQSK